MISKAIITIEMSGMISTSLLEWRAGSPIKNWQDLKQLFSEAYQLLFRSSAQEKNLKGAVANVQSAVYHLEDAEDDNEMLTTLTDALGSVTLANIANTQALRKDVSTLRANIAILRNILQRGGNFVASNATAVWGRQYYWPSPPLIQAPPILYVAAPLPPQYAGPPIYPTPSPSTGRQGHHSPLPCATHNAKGN